VFKSIDGGGNWSVYNSGLPYDIKIKTTTIDPITSNTLCVGTWNKVVFKSPDGGRNWSYFGLSCTIIRILVIDPIAPTILCAGTDNGVYSIRQLY
jgi:hypothetical protein